MGRTLEINHGRVDRMFEPVDPAKPPALARDLGAAIAGEVRFDSGSRALYATDASNYRQVPIGVVVPRTIEDVVATIGLCHDYDVPVVARGGGTSLAGQGCNVAVLIDFSKYLDRILDLDPQRKLATVDPGCVLDVLRDVAERHSLTFGPDPATHGQCTLGGMIGNNSGGVHSVMAGLTADNVEALDIVTYDGVRLTVGRTTEEALAGILDSGGRPAEIYRRLDEFRRRHGDLIRARYPKIPRRVSGYENLDELLPENGFNVARALVGTEATCVTVLKATVNLVDSPQVRALAIVGFDDVFLAADAVPEVLEYQPVGLEGIDDMLIEFTRKKELNVGKLKLLPVGKGWLMAEFGGSTEEEARSAAERLVRDFRGSGHDCKLLTGPEDQAGLWEIRDAALGATAHVPDEPETYDGWEDSAVPREALGAYLRDLKALFHRHGYQASVYGHFGGGLVHCRIPFNLRSERGLRDWQRFLDEAADLVVRYGGSFSGEHGDGQARGALLEKMYGPELVQAFREFKAIWDPQGRMNPGKVVDPFPPTSNLRLGPDYRPPAVSTYFAYADDGGSFAKAAERCVGVGKCRRPTSDHDVMCPSYMATREEKHSTRGRARLLFEMLHGGPIDDGWRSKAVDEALDLCLSCKGCKSDCPVSVDMATYKAEFRAHHYAGRLRPRAAYSMGLIHRWSWMAGRVPWLANALIQTPGLSSALKWAGGIAQARPMPRYADQPFVSWFRARERRQKEGRRVLLWPDTFNNYFRPATAIAATRALEALGFAVVIPNRPLCCGRPLYDWGLIDSAKALWRDTFAALGREIEAGTPVVGLEPACVSTFRDELVSLFADDERATRLREQTWFFSDFIDSEFAKSGRNVRPNGRPTALVQVHCHHHAVVGFEAERRLLDRLGIDADVLPSGCCGMAGAFGFEAEKYEISMQLAERVLLPRVRTSPADRLVLANGFSCREQIEQATGRATRHIAELVAERLA